MSVEADTRADDAAAAVCAPSTSCQALRHAVCALYTLDDFAIEQFLGEGFFSRVFKVTHKATGGTMVLKMCRQDICGRNNNVSPVPSKCSAPVRPTSLRSSSPAARYRRMRILREIELINKLRHPNVLEFIGVCIDRSLDGSWQLHALTEHCNGGSLHSLIMDRQRSVSWLTWANLTLDVATGMCYVHQNGYMHRDLTSMNVLLKENGYLLRALVADFGLACRTPKAGDDALPQVGTPYWMAPECLCERRYGPPADVFAFGVIVCQCVARIDADPECGLPRTPVFGLDYVALSRRCPPAVPAPLLRLAFQCCTMDPQRRPTFNAVVRSLINVLRALRESTAGAARDRRPVRSVSDEQLAASAYTDLTTVRQCGEEGGDTRSCASPSASVLLATTVAQQDPFYEPLQANPFLRVAKYRDGRKIVAARWGSGEPPHGALSHRPVDSEQSDADSGCDDAASTSSLPPPLSHMASRRTRGRHNKARNTVDVGTSPIRDADVGPDEACRRRLPAKFSACDERFAMRHCAKHRHSVQPVLPVQRQAAHTPQSTVRSATEPPTAPTAVLVAEVVDPTPLCASGRQSVQRACTLF